MSCERDHDLDRHERDDQRQSDCQRAHLRVGTGSVGVVGVVVTHGRQSDAIYLPRARSRCSSRTCARVRAQRVSPKARPTSAIPPMKATGMRSTHE